MTCKKEDMLQFITAINWFNKSITPVRANEYKSVYQFALITFFHVALCGFPQNREFDLTKLQQY